MKNRIICLVLSLALVVGLFCTNGAYAWFVASIGGSSGASAGHSITAGNVDFTIDGGFKSLPVGSKIVPEDELLAGEGSGCKMSLTNSSTIKTQLRIKIEYTYNNATATYNLDEAADSPLTVVLSNSSAWDYNGGYLYYGTYDAEAATSEDLEVDNVGIPILSSVPLFNSIRYSGDNADSSAISNSTVTVRVIFEARQSAYVNWSTVGTISVSA